MTFGRFGREENALVMITTGGGLIIQILKRTAQFAHLEQSSILSGTLNSLDKKPKKLDVPKKTKLYVDQTLRERENSVAMHRMFQHDLYLLRLNTARAFVESIKTSANPVAGSGTGVSENDPIKMSAQVLGLGPVFRLIIGLCNTSPGKPSRNLMITFYCDDKLYAISKNVIRVPMLVPGLEYNFETLVECVSDLGIADQIRVFVVHDPFPPNVLNSRRNVSRNQGKFLTFRKKRHMHYHNILLNLEKNLLSICQIILGNASNSVQGGKKENSSSCSQSGKPIVSAIINMPVSEAI